MRRARALAPEAADLLEAAAVLGPGSEPRHAAALAGPRPGAGRADGRPAGRGRRARRARTGSPSCTRPSRPPCGPRSPRACSPRRTCGPPACWRRRTLTRRPWLAHLLQASRGGGDWVIAVLRRTAPRALWRRATPLAPWSCSSGPGRSRRRRRSGRTCCWSSGRAEAITGSAEAAGRLTDAIARLPEADERARAALDAGRTLLALGRLSDAAAAFELGVRDAAEESDLGGLLRAGRATVLRMLRGRAGVVAEAARGARRGPGRPPTAPCSPSWPSTPLFAASRASARSSWPAAPWPVAPCSTTTPRTASPTTSPRPRSPSPSTSRWPRRRWPPRWTTPARARSALGLATASHFSAYAIMRRGRVAAAAAAARDALAGQRHGWGLAVASARALLAECLIEGGDLEGRRAADRAGRRAPRARTRSPGSRTSPGAAGCTSWAAPRRGAGRLHGLRRDPRRGRRSEPVRAAVALRGRAGPLGRSATTTRRGCWPRRSSRSRATSALPGRSAGPCARWPGWRRARVRSSCSRRPWRCLEDSPTALERARALVELGSALTARAAPARCPRAAAPRPRPRPALRRGGAGPPCDARGDRRGRPPAAHRAPRARGPDPQGAPDGRPGRRGHVEPGDRGRSVRDPEDRGVAPEAHLRQARDLLASRAGAGARRARFRRPATRTEPPPAAPG